MYLACFVGQSKEREREREREREDETGQARDTCLPFGRAQVSNVK